MASEIRVDKITSLSGVGTITPSSSGIDITGITTVATLKATTGIVTTLTVTTGNLTITNTAPQISLVDSDNNSDFSIYGAGGVFNIYDETNTASRFTIASDGTVSVIQGLELSSTLTIPDSIIHSGDTNTKIRFPAADTVTVETGGSERFRIDSSGFMGLGTNSPTDTGGYGQALDITGGSSGAAIYLRASNGDTGQIALGSGDLTIRTRQADPIILSTNNSERVRIDSNGTVLHGSGAIATQKATNGGLDVAANGHSIVFGADSNLGNPSQARTNNAAKDQRISAVHYTNAEEPIGIVRAYSDSSTNQLYWGGGSSLFNAATTQSFYTAANNTTTNGTERVRIHSGGTVNIPSGITLGQSITFTGASNTLNDYEEGTFTPIISDGSTTSTFGSVTSATYTKIGNTVRASFRAVNVQTSGLSGGAPFYVQGLPFTTTGKNYNSAFIRTWNSSTWGAAKCINFALVENDRVYFLSDDGSTTGGVTLKIEDMIHNQSDVFMTMVYETTQ